MEAATSKDVSTWVTMITFAIIIITVTWIGYRMFVRKRVYEGYTASTNTNDGSTIIPKIADESHAFIAQITATTVKLQNQLLLTQYTP